jgi:drug/metabolite transporter (DMT)-like permease
MTTPHRGGLAAEFLLLGVLALLWGSSYLFIKVAVTEIPPVTLIVARASIAAVFLMAVVRFRGDTLPRDGRT